MHPHFLMVSWITAIDLMCDPCHCTSASAHGLIAVNGEDRRHVMFAAPVWRAGGQRGVRIGGWGKYIPERILTNADLERMVETSDEWIVTRTGIRQRHIAADHEGTTSMMLAA